MPSFDIVSEVNQVEVRNALDQANKELSTRFDFKGSDARVEQTEKTLTLFADDEFKLSQVTDILTGKLAKRGVDVRSLKYGDVEKVSGNKVKQVVTVRVGVEQELAKKIVKLVKDSKLKVQASHPGRRGARVRREARRAAERDRAGEEIDHRLPAAVQQLPRLTVRLLPVRAAFGSVVLRRFRADRRRARRGRCVATRAVAQMTALDPAAVHGSHGRGVDRDARQTARSAAPTRSCVAPGRHPDRRDRLAPDATAADVVGYWIGRPYWGRGYATDGARDGCARTRVHLASSVDARAGRRTSRATRPPAACCRSAGMRELRREMRPPPRRRTSRNSFVAREAWHPRSSAASNVRRRA